MDCNANKVQHVTKKSSDELLRKFADEDDGGVEARKGHLSRVSKRRKRRRTSRREEGGGCESPSHYSGGTALVERRSLLAHVTRKSALLRQLGIAGTIIRPRLRARDTKKNTSVLAAIEQTWRETLERASKAILETRYNRHRRLINDMV